jgi:quinol monooxygenase YgiN
MSGRRHRDDDWDDARRAPSDDRRDGWADDAPDGWADRRRSGGSDRGLGDRGMSDRGTGGRGMSDRGADRGFGDRGAGGDRGASDRGAGNYDFEDWYVGGAKRRGSAQGGSAHGGGTHGGGAPGGNGQGGYRGPDYQGQGSGDPGWGQPRQDRGGYGDPGYGDYRPGRDYPDQGRDYRDAARNDYGSGNGGRYNGSAPRREASPEFTPTVSAPPASGGSASGRPYGRLSIFTLLDDKGGEFDQLAERAAEGVRSLEPDTLVYVIHVVPKAPMQRIIYEIYRDRAAFDAHERQPHIQQFVADSKACVLATNIIDLRLKYAKVAPLGGAAQPASGQASLPAAPPRAPRALESGSRASSDGRYGNPGNGRYNGASDGGYRDPASLNRSGAPGAGY